MIRTFKPADKDYIIQSHYKLYHNEFQYDLSFRDFIADSVTGFMDRSNPRENIWILEINGKQKGSISIKEADDDTAQLGLFLLDPSTRGCGYGQKLLETAIDFCKEAGYETVILWTNSELTAARKLYQRNGFERTETRVRLLSNKERTEEQWARPLSFC
ncbi:MULTISPECIES: GNAT family N-acetyltransferase [Shouchella]|jgi:ribosomal protein S18 acetylase RimI-like enzyme|uniref:GNAT family N-acetyltransferase n=1 Tax=Shouchella TaxID=2893057 RepID=UPI0007C5543B|nr:MULTISPECIES: GNAT family N-acetyltransferase [Shouchella]MCM3380894.1 GNAT family N-acetyltransferase [Shouchella rhizosphaerae]MDO7284948.1 GNAT family N-acetyltransferase [Shouchella clausii]MDO7305184.1 GNAT family N-acetyltransferase [Shouchella clausii]PAD17719.1 N-acetyltransferase [Shouchella clausii]PAD47472.1 N-acetyltransferase [Shouchella clausii]